MIRLPVVAWCIVALAVSCGGCANYQLGTGSKAAFRTLHVEPVSNRTALPQAQAVVSTQLRESFARDARSSLVNSAGAAEAILTVVIIGYRREVAAVREGDTGLARKFNVTLEALCSLRDNRSGKAVFEGRTIAATREVFTDGGQLQAEYQALPLLAESLAAKITRASLDVW